jgi:hypothetical protein
VVQTFYLWKFSFIWVKINLCSGFRVLGSGFRVLGSGVPGFRVQGSAPPPAKKTAGQIERETDVRRSICLLFNPGRAIEAASLIIKKTVPFWHSFIQGFRGSGVLGSKATLAGNWLL